VIVNDLARAYEIANMEEPDGGLDCPTSPWRITSEYYSSLFISTPEANEHYDRINESLSFFYSKWCSSPLGGQADFSEAAEWAQSDLSRIALHRAVFGVVDDSFFDALFALYRQGLWPCGWQDHDDTADNTWPAPGRFVAWCPAP
jgi:hypothetical protein